MKKTLTFLLIFILIFININTYADTLELNAKSAIIANADSVQILYEKNADDTVYPEGFTKLMTAIVAFEKLGSNKDITTPSDILDHYTSADYSIASKPGEKFKSGELISAMVICSANDAAYTLAIASYGSEEKFVDAMNKKAEKMGLKKTKFLNIYGNHNNDQVSTPKDLLAIYRYMLNNKFLNTIITSSSTTVEATNEAPKRTLWSSNYFCSTYYDKNYFNPSVLGGKSSFSSVGGQSIIAHGIKNGVKVICVVLSSENEKEKPGAYDDAQKMFDYSFTNYKKVNIVKIDEMIFQPAVKFSSGTKKVLLHSDRTLSALILNDEEPKDVIKQDIKLDNIIAPIKVDEKLGVANYSYNGKTVGSVNLVSKEEVSGSYISWFFSFIFSLLTSTTAKVILIIACVLIAVYIAYTISENKKKRRRKRKR